MNKLMCNKIVMNVFAETIIKNNSINIKSSNFFGKREVFFGDKFHCLVESNCLGVVNCTDLDNLDYLELLFSDDLNGVYKCSISRLVEKYFNNLFDLDLFNFALGECCNVVFDDTEYKKGCFSVDDNSSVIIPDRIENVLSQNVKFNDFIVNFGVLYRKIQRDGALKCEYDYFNNCISRVNAITKFSEELLKLTSDFPDELLWVDYVKNIQKCLMNNEHKFTLSL